MIRHSNYKANSRILALCLLTLGAVVVFDPAAKRGCVAESRLTGIDEEKTDFGYAPQYSKLSRVYWLKSIDNDTLKIHNVKPGCGCTEIPLDKKIVPPGDSARLELIFDSRRYRGAVKRKPQIQVVGELFPRILNFSAYVITDEDEMAPINVVPRTFDIPPGETAELLKLQITNSANEMVYLKLAHPQTEFYLVDLPDSIAAGVNSGAEIRIHESAQKQPFENSFTLEATYEDGRKVSRHTIPVRYQVIPDSSITIDSTETDGQ